MQAPAEKLDFFNYSFKALSELLHERFSEPAYRAGQLFEWVYKRKVLDIDLMTNIKRDLREKLKALFYFSEAVIEERQISSDGTRKYLFRTAEGNLVESVMIKQPGRMTLCISSQVGCGMGCKFCRTGTMGFQKNLKTSEIIGQVNAVIKDALNFSDSFSNIVFMGMGEPLHNFRAVTEALDILTHDHAFKFGPRKITVSTVGLVPAIKKFADAGMPASLAVSLNATTDEVRSQIMPINDAYPIEDLLATLSALPLKKRARITIEYVMLKGVNDLKDDLKRLVRMLRGMPVKINLIPYNENAGLGFKQPAEETIKTWQSKITSAGFSCTVRWSKGRDIDAACGQLSTNQIAKKKKIELQTPVGQTIAENVDLLNII